MVYTVRFHYDENFVNNVQLPKMRSFVLANKAVTPLHYFSQVGRHTEKFERK
jgi:hypothetical protein